MTYLLAGIAAIWLLAAVSPFVSLHMVLLDKAHVTLVTAKRLLSCEETGETLCHNKGFIRTDTRPSQNTCHVLKLTTVDLLVPLEQILLDEAHVTLTAPERPLPCAIKSTTIRSPH